MTVKVNYNQMVKVKLTHHGEQVYKRYKEAEFLDTVLFHPSHKSSMHPEPTPIRLDEDGYFTDQLWTIMNIFGEHMAPTFLPVFEGGELLFEDYED